jgi:hypothetical protein
VYSNPVSGSYRNFGVSPMSRACHSSIRLWLVPTLVLVLTILPALALYASGLAQYRLFQQDPPTQYIEGLGVTQGGEIVERGGIEQRASIGQSTKPLENILNPDGTLNMSSGFTGSLDPTGWSMQTAQDGSPRFVPAALASTQLADSASTPLAPARPQAEGDENWDNRFNGPGTSNHVFALAVSGSDIYVGGLFQTVGDQTAYNIARWDGTQWHAVGKGVSYIVNAIAVSGTDIYVGGGFTEARDSTGIKTVNNIARWDGTQWHALGSGVTSHVKTVVVSGTDIYVGGGFIETGDSTGYKIVNNIARWDGTQWQALGSGLNDTVTEIAVNGTDVYAGGWFTTATDSTGTKTVNRIARWDGTQWHALGSGVNNFVWAVALSGTDLYIGGDFTEATDSTGTKTVNYIAKWDGTQWSALGSGTDYEVLTIVVNGSGSEVDIYVGGWFDTATDSTSTKTVNNIARWNGSQWQTIGSGVNNAVNTIAVSGTDLYIGGAFITATDGTGTETVNYITQWDGTQWHALGSGATLNDGVRAIAISGTDVYVGGYFTEAIDGTGSKAVNYITKWDGTQWHVLGSGLNDAVLNIVVSGSGSGADVYAGGWFTTATDSTGTKTVNHIARWDGSQWHALGSGVSDAVRAIAVSGTDVYVGGRFLTATDSAGTKTVNHIARWDGSQWHALGSGMNNFVRAIAVSGTDVYVGGDFTEATDSTATKIVNHIARWDGTQWSAIGSGVNDVVEAIAVSGTDIYVGGRFLTATDSVGTKNIDYIARWGGSQWHALGSRVSGFVWAIAVSGADVYIGGCFVIAVDSTDSRTVNYIAKWDGSQLPALGSGVNDFVEAIAVNGSDVYAGGYFTVAGGKSSVRFGLWHSPTGTTTPTPTTTGTSTRTATPMTTATPVIAATACAIQFEDVPPGDTFYQFIRCLACRHIVSGYPCGAPGEPCNDDDELYYRPGANVTRGQLSKIITNAAGLNDPIPMGQRQFADVRPGDPFYEFVERLAQTGAIGGYPCGGPGEGCDEEKRSYFRPNSPATRGQISKIVSIAAEFEEDIPAGQQTFTDVDEDSPFWAYIERLSSRGIISGYGEAARCPETGAQCFRYNDLTTRGQMTKIAANAFFPNCQTQSPARK